MTNRIQNLLPVFAITFLFTGCVTPNFQPVASVPDDKALVYVYRKAHIIGAAGRHQINVNGEPVGVLPNGGYFPYFASPGTNQFSSSFLTTMIVDGVPIPKSLLAGPHLLTLTAVPGRTYYLQFKIATTWGPKMLQMDAETGARDIAKCRLIQAAP
jgi:hypothetical protein